MSCLWCGTDACECECDCGRHCPVHGCDSLGAPTCRECNGEQKIEGEWCHGCGGYGVMLQTCEECYMEELEAIAKAEERKKKRAGGVSLDRHDKLAFTKEEVDSMCDAYERELKALRRELKRAAAELRKKLLDEIRKWEQREAREGKG
jgi:hypothetical protein